jgi:hypothetical protein
MSTKNEWDATGIQRTSLTSDIIDYRWNTAGDTTLDFAELNKAIRYPVDVETPWRAGKSRLVEAIGRHQRRAANVILKCSGDLLACTTAVTSPFLEEPKSINCQLVLECSGRLILLECGARGDSVSEQGVGGFLRWLPKPIAEAYYWMHGGWDVIADIPSNPMDNRMLPAKHWKPLKYCMERNLTLDQSYVAVSRLRWLWPQEFCDDWEVQCHVRCFIDNRPHGNNGLRGDMIFARALDPDRNLYHILDSDFEHPRVIIDPINTIDLYVEHVLLWRHERFDFSAFSKPL